jgi:hypothetical protein
MNPAETYILSQPEPFRSILLHIQFKIQVVVPKAEVRYKYKIPFFYVDNRPLCYINQSKDYVDVAFWHSAHMSKHLNKMEAAGRKVVRSLRYRNLEAIDDTVLTEVLEEALVYINKSFYKK